jgi:polar amino acid transport system substrate-binding protein
VRRRPAAIRVVASLCGVVLIAGGCNADTTSTPDATQDELAQILARGTLILSTDPDYAPQSFAVPNAERRSNTKCADDQLTGPEVSGYDAETGKAVAEALGVEPCFVTPQWVEITAGSWGERWDLSFGSGAIDADRMRYLYVTQPYYVLPAYPFVPEASAAREPEDLSGTRIGVCTSCTHENYLLGSLELPGFDGDYRITGAHVVGYTVEMPGLQDTAAGKLDAFLCAEQVGRQAIEDGLALRRIGEPLFEEYATGWIDKGSELDVTTFVDRVNAIVRDLHASGRMRELSIRFFGRDYAAAAATFDLSTVPQETT